MGDVTDFITIQMECQSLTNSNLLENLFSSLVRWAEAFVSQHRWAPLPQHIVGRPGGQLDTDHHQPGQGHCLSWPLYRFLLKSTRHSVGGWLDSDHHQPGELSLSICSWAGHGVEGNFWNIKQYRLDSLTLKQTGFNIDWAAFAKHWFWNCLEKKEAQIPSTESL